MNSVCIKYQSKKKGQKKIIVQSFFAYILYYNAVFNKIIRIKNIWKRVVIKHKGQT